jgi:2-methylcitrate dehydratase PrpD
MVTPIREWEGAVYEFLGKPVPEDVRAHGKKIVADVIAAGVAGSAQPGVEPVSRSGSYSDGPSTVWGTNRRVSAEDAALLNATASVAPEIEEGHNFGGHVGATTVAGAVAMAESRDVDGETLVDAVVKAYEIFVRLEAAITPMKSTANADLPWALRNPHATWTTVGPAIASGLCMGLTEERLADTLRIAGNQAVLSMHDPYEEGATVRNFMAGFSAQTGVATARAVEAGLTGPETAISEVYDPVRETDESTFDETFEELGAVWESTRNYFKFVPSCRYTQPPLDALRDAASDIDPTTVERVEVYTFGRATAMDYQDAAPLTSAKFSTPYVIARELATGGDLWLDDFSAEAVDDPLVRALAERVSVQTGEEYEESFPAEHGARVEVTLTNGRRLIGECRFPEGDHRNYPGDDRLKAKFRRLFAERFDDLDEPLAAVLDLNNRDVRAVGAKLRPETNR